MNRYRVGWIGLASLVGMTELATATPGTTGLLETTVCISPLALLVLTFTPAETLSTQLMKRLGGEPTNGGGKQ